MLRRKLVTIDGGKGNAQGSGIGILVYWLELISLAKVVKYLAICAEASSVKERYWLKTKRPTYQRQAGRLLMLRCFPRRNKA